MQRPNLSKAPVGTTVHDNGVERTVHAHQTMEFPKARQEALERMEQQRLAAQTAPQRSNPNPNTQQRLNPASAMAIPTSVNEAAAAPYPFAGQAPQGQNAAQANPQLSPQQQAPTLPPIPPGRVAARHAHAHASAAPNQEQGFNQQQQRPMAPIRPQTIQSNLTGPSAAPVFDEPEPNVFEGVQTVPNEHPGFTAPVIAGEASSLDLPSRFWAYGFKDLYATPFVAFHLAKMSRAHEEGSLLPMVEVVSSVLQSSGIDPHVSIAHQLTVPDFYFVLYWLKLHSFTKGSYLHTTMCMNPEHHKQVTSGLKPKESLKLQEMVTRSTLQVKNLLEVPDASFNLGDDCEFYLQPATMQDTLEFLEHPQAADIEFQYAARRASFIRHRDGYMSFDERVAAFRPMSADQVLMIEQYEKICDSYGVQEKIVVRCKECGASRVTKMTLDAHSFLSA